MLRPTREELADGVEVDLPELRIAPAHRVLVRWRNRVASRRRGRAGGRRGGGGQPEADALALEAAGATPLRPEQVVRRIKQLEGEMFRKARNLEFEEAARLRDQIERLKRSELGLTGQRTG
jgi:CO/xanthine dehydrogenase FAD-binding subunit